MTRLVLVLALAACGKSRLAASLEDRLAAEGVTATVRCKGTTCTATDAATGVEFAIDVAGTEWHPHATIVDTRQLSRDISQQRRGWAAVGCERDVIVLPKDASTTCVIWDKGPRLLAVTATGEPAHPLRWEIVRR